MPPSSQVGSAHVKITSDSAEARQDIDRTKGKLNEFGETIEKRTAGVRRFAGAITSMAGVLTGLLGVVALVSGALLALQQVLETGTDRAEKFINALSDPFGEQVASNISSITSKIETLTGKLAGLTDDDGLDRFFGGITTFRANQVLDEIRRLEEERDKLLKQSGQQELSRRRQSATDAADAEILAQTDAARRIEQETLNLFLQTLSEKDRAQREFEIANGRTRRKIADEDDDRNKKLLEAQLRFIEQIRDTRIKAIDDAAAAQKRADDERERRDRERQQEKERREIESANRIADALAKSLSSALENINQTATNTTLENIQGTIESLGPRLNAFAARAGGPQTFGPRP